MMSWIDNYKKGLLAATVLLQLFLGGCVTTRTGGTESNMDTEKALEKRVQLVLNYVRQGNRDLARSSLNKARAIDADDPRVLNATAMLYQLEGEPLLAEKEFKKAIGRNPEFSTARNNYGVLLSSQERYQEALEQFEGAGRDLEYDRRDVALTNLGQTAQLLGMHEKAKASFEHAVRLNPKSLTPIIELAKIEFSERNYAQAKGYLDRADTLGSPTPQSLWLGIRLERIFGNRDKEASLALALKNMYPYSAEYLEYKRLLDD
ncbi:type IV pilus biogenesis/stability protein PilW [Halioxenophilus sp. WMMB6]|uniref:type IV pilus biogenesis/stability protein PilW n=1 Tax=Halioxenophilus sp. WMMB6 TaxID=3073815 RepID=UPI00295E7F7D|nr:type IV pilus biogenesis/stability protein PilW [Halioxenophilus sp. WMMB6]